MVHTPAPDTGSDAFQLPRMWHVFPLYTEACGQEGKTLPPATRALAQVAAFVREVLDGP